MRARFPTNHVAHHVIARALSAAALAAAVVVVLAACGAPSAGGVAIAFAAADRDGAELPADALAAAPVTAVADVDRAFPVDADAALDLEVVDDGGTHVRVTITDAGAPALDRASLLGRPLSLTTSPPCCLGTDASAVLADDDDGALLAVAFTGGNGFGERGLALASDGGRTLPAPITCGTNYEIGVRVSGDDGARAAAVLARSERATVRAAGVDVVVHVGGAEHIDSQCEDARAGDVIAWTALRADAGG